MTRGGGRHRPSSGRFIRGECCRPAIGFEGEIVGRKTGRVAVSVSASVIGVLVMFVLGNGSAVAHQQGNKLHLGDAPPNQRVEGISYCDGIYRVITKEGSPVEYPEFDLRFKTDASPDGPPPGTPVVINAGMKGDRGFVIFSAPSEIGAFIKTKC